MTEPNMEGMQSSLSIRYRMVQAVHSPLGFFVLALLIVEAFLFGAGIWFELSDTWRLIAIGTGVGLFLLVFCTVVWLVVKYPQYLVFGEESHVQYEAMKMFGTNRHLITMRDLDQLVPESTQVPSQQLPDGSN